MDAHTRLTTTILMKKKTPSCPAEQLSTTTTPQHSNTATQQHSNTATQQHSNTASTSSQSAPHVHRHVVEIEPTSCRETHTCASTPSSRHPATAETPAAKRVRATRLVPAWARLALTTVPCLPLPHDDDRRRRRLRSPENRYCM